MLQKKSDQGEQYPLKAAFYDFWGGFFHQTDERPSFPLSVNHMTFALYRCDMRYAALKI